MKPWVLQVSILLVVKGILPPFPFIVMHDVGDMLGQLRDSVPMLVQAIRSRPTSSPSTNSAGKD